MTSESSNTATLVGRMRHYAKHPGCSRALNAACAEAAGALSDLAKELEEARAEVERLKDFGGDAVAVAGQILENLGIGQDASKEPGADRRRDRVAAIIERNSTRQRDEALAALKASEAREDEMRRVLEKFAGRIDEIEQVKAVSKFATEGTAAVKLSLLREARAVLATKEMGHG